MKAAKRSQLEAHGWAVGDAHAFLGLIDEDAGARVVEAYRIETTLMEDGTVTVASLPYKAGQQVEIIILPAVEPGAGRGHE